MPFTIQLTERGKESNLKKFSIKIYTHVMKKYVVVVLAGHYGDAALRTIAYLGDEPTFTMVELVSYAINQSELLDFRTAIIKDGGFYFNDKLTRIEYLKQDYQEILTIGIDRYAIIPS